MESGLLTFQMAPDPQVTFDQKKKEFLLTSQKFDTEKHVQYLVDARISKVQISEDTSPLFRNMLKRGLISLFENKTNAGSYHPGCINISREGYVIDQNENINPHIAVAGTPTEGVTLDNDTLSTSRNNFVSRWAAQVAKNIQEKKVKANV